MTAEQREKLERIGGEIHAIFPDSFGKVIFSFNLKPDRKEVNMNIGTEFSTIIKPLPKG